MDIWTVLHSFPANLYYKLLSHRQSFFIFFIWITLIFIFSTKNKKIYQTLKLYKNFWESKPGILWKIVFHWKCQSHYKSFLLASFIRFICSLFIQIKLFDFEIDKEIEHRQHTPLFLYIPLSYKITSLDRSVE